MARGDPGGHGCGRLDSRGRALLLDPGAPHLRMKTLAVRSRQALEDPERALPEIGVHVRDAEPERLSDDLRRLVRTREVARRQPRQPRSAGTSATLRA